MSIKSADTYNDTIKIDKTFEISTNHETITVTLIILFQNETFITNKSRNNDSLILDLS